jgi:prepilin-type N-terminal cleavage/methylation domain-containing protein
MPNRAPGGNSGFALLEVLVAIALLGGAGLATVLVLRQATRAEALAAQEERILDQADRVLCALTLLTARELEQRVGRHQIGEFEARIERPEPGLYRIAIHSADSSARQLLVTVVARVTPESAS